MKKKTAYIIGNGPSLANENMSLLKDKITMSFNRAFIAYEDWGFDPTYYLAIDGNTMRGMHKDVNELIDKSNIERFFLLNIEDNPAHGYVDELFTKADNVTFITNSGTHVINDGTPPFTQAYEMDKNNVVLPVAPNSGMTGLAILRMLGYNEIAFIGQDARYIDDAIYRNGSIEKISREYRSSEDNDQNHFRSDYFGKGMIFGKPNQDDIINLWSTASPWIHEQSDFDVYSCTPGSNLNPYYRYIPLEDFVEGKRECEMPAHPQIKEILQNKENTNEVSV
tara:strand:- start:3772 stop:4611 length:840 start_codon:yes stop_codon:yes gene_type:complete